MLEKYKNYLVKNVFFKNKKNQVTLGFFDSNHLIIYY